MIGSFLLMPYIGGVILNTYFEFDGGFIMVPWNRFDEGVAWYSEHMGWSLIDTANGPVGRKAFFNLPGGGQANLKSFESDLDHFVQDGYAEGNCRFCFRTGNLEQTLAYFREQGVECSEQVALPDGTFAADIQAFADVRLTLSEDRKLDGQYPGVRAIRFGAKPLWLGVRDLEAACSWYETVLGLKRTKNNYSGRGFALMADPQNDWDYVWLEQLPSDTPIVKANPGARLYFVIRDSGEFRETHRLLNESGIETSSIVGERWMGFHFYDPDGNRLNVWNY